MPTSCDRDAKSAKRGIGQNRHLTLAMHGIILSYAHEYEPSFRNLFGAKKAFVCQFVSIVTTPLKMFSVSGW